MKISERKQFHSVLWAGLFLIYSMTFSVSPPSVAAVTNPPELVKNIRSGVSSSELDLFTNVNGTLFFSTVDIVNGTAVSHQSYSPDSAGKVA